MADLTPAEATADPCCATEQQTTCCGPSERDDCCTTGSSRGLSLPDAVTLVVAEMIDANAVWTFDRR